MTSSVPRDLGRAATGASAFQWRFALVVLGLMTLTALPLRAADIDEPMTAADGLDLDGPEIDGADEVLVRPDGAIVFAGTELGTWSDVAHVDGLRLVASDSFGRLLLALIPVVDPVPDADVRGLLLEVDGDQATLVHTWVGTDRARLIDLDSDGVAELVIDRSAAPPPCGWPDVLSDPLVFDAELDRFRGAAIRRSVSPTTPRLAHETTRFDTVDDPLGRPTSWSAGWSTSGDTSADGATPQGWRTPGRAMGQWLTFDPAPELAVTIRVRASRPALLLLERPGSPPTVLAADIEPREFALPPSSGSPCALLSVVDGHQEPLEISHIALLTEADLAPPETRARDHFVPAVAAACERDDARGAARLAEAAARSDLDVAVAALVGLSEEPASTECFSRALVAAVARVDTGANTRIEALSARSFNDREKVALTNTLQRGDLTAIAESLSTGFDSALYEAARRLMLEDAPSDDAVDALVRLLESDDAALRELAVLAAPFSESSSIAAALRANTDTAARIDALRAALVAPPSGGTAMTDALMPLFDHENGSVARLAILAAGRHADEAALGRMLELATEDNQDAIRAAAVRAVAAMLDRDSTQSSLGSEWIARAFSDHSPVVRVAAGELAVSIAARGDSTPLTANLLAAENWSEVRHAWIEAAVAANSTSLDNELIALVFDQERDAAVALRAFAGRGTATTDDTLLLMHEWRASRLVLPAAMSVAPLLSSGCPLEWLRDVERDDALPDDARRLASELIASDCQH